jgi:cysteine desulfurase
MIYFDNNATTQIADEAVEAMLPFLKGNFGNPSSAHAVGSDVRRAIGEARSSVAELLGASPDEILFTSGGTESDNWAIRSALSADATRNKIVTTKVEHEAVRKTCEQLESLGTEVIWLDVDSDGVLDLGQLRDSVDEHTALVSIMWANNETGVLFPIAEIAEIVKSRSDALVHVDAVNAVGKIEIDLSKTAIDLLSISAHKFHGPKGIGALFVRNGVNLPAMMIGGGQEGGRRAGTEAVHQIVGMGAAAKIVADPAPMVAVEKLRDRLERSIIETIPNASVNGSRPREHRLPNTSYISFENINGEMLLSAFDDHGVCVSTGSACNSETKTASPVLAAMNIPYSRAMGSIRFSLGRFNTEAEVDRVLELLPGLVSALG